MMDRFVDALHARLTAANKVYLSGYASDDVPLRAGLSSLHTPLVPTQCHHQPFFGGGGVNAAAGCRGVGCRVAAVSSSDDVATSDSGRRRRQK